MAVFIEASIEPSRVVRIRFRLGWIKVRVSAAMRGAAILSILALISRVRIRIKFVIYLRKTASVLAYRNDRQLTLSKRYRKLYSLSFPHQSIGR
jgi:hypothetical protein